MAVLKLTVQDKKLGQDTPTYSNGVNRYMVVVPRCTR